MASETEGLKTPMFKKAPRKYADKERTEVRPEWLAWRKEQDEFWALAGSWALGPGGMDLYFPEDCDKDIPEGGCWIRILEEPHTVLKQTFRLPVMSVWFARPHTMNTGKHFGRSPQLAKILTPGGELCLYPHEYAKWDDPTWLVGQEPEVVMHDMGGDLALDTDDEERLFFLMKAGINRHDALMLMLTEGVDPRCWFEFSEAYAETLGDIGRPLWRHVQLNPRKPKEAVDA